MNEQSSEKQIYKNCLYLRQESCDLHSNSALKRITYIKEYLEKQREVREELEKLEEMVRKQEDIIKNNKT